MAPTNQDNAIFNYIHDQAEVKRVLLKLQELDWEALAGDVVVKDELQRRLALMSEVMEAQEITDGPDYMHVGKWTLSFLDVDLANSFLANPDDDSLQQDFAEQIKVLSYATGLEPGLRTSSMEELEKLLIGEIDDKYQLAHTLGSLGDETDEMFAYKMVVMSFLTSLDWVAVNLKYSWEETLFLVLILRAVWKWFPLKLDDVERELLCQKYFYFAIVAGLPVRKILEDYLKRSADASVYVLRDKLLVEALDKNIENVPVNIITYRWEPLPKLMAGFLEKSAVHEGGQEFNEYILAVYGEAEGKDRYVSWLQETFYIITRLKKADLIDQLYNEEESIGSEYEKEMFQLILRFLSHPLAWEGIAKYFSNPKHLVPFKSFILQLAIHENIDSEEAINKYLEFTKLMREKGVLKPDEEIVVYHEEDKKFHFNNSLATL